MLLALLALAPTELSCAALRKGVRFEVRPGVSATLRLTGDKRFALRQFTSRQFTLRTGAQTVQITGECSTASADDPAAVVADFNFDGWQDVAVRTGTYVIAGFYDLFLYRPAIRSFQKNQYGGSQAFNFAGNSFPSPDPLTQTVSGAFRSSRSSALATFCLTSDGQNLYPCRRGEPSSVPTEAADDFDWTWYDQSGKEIIVCPLRHSGEDNSLWTVLPARLPLHSGPSLGSPSRAYVIRGNLVEVLELRGSPASGWAHVTYAGEGGRVSKGWVQRQLIR